VGPEQSKFADVTNVVARLQQQFDLDPRRGSSLSRPAWLVLAMQAAFLIVLHFMLR
jgi:hypothetical protein